MGWVEGAGASTISTEWEEHMNTDALHPDLKPWLDYSWANSVWLKHPLVFCCPLSDTAHANEMYERKKARLAEAIAKEDWNTFIFTHERPYRFDALLDLLSREIPAKEYGRLLGEAWIDSNNVYQNRRAWRNLWSAPDIDVSAAMDEKERSALAALPDLVTVYRGTQHPRTRAPLSWSLDQDKAHWFAARSGTGGFLLTGKARKNAIKAVFFGRKEDEVVALRVKVVSVRQVAKGEPCKWRPNDEPITRPKIF
jgi:hypothetical protein